MSFRHPVRDFPKREAQREKNDTHFGLRNHEVLLPDARACSGGGVVQLDLLGAWDIL